MEGSSYGSKKYGLIKTIINEVVKIYPWMDRNKVYNGVKAIMKRQVKKVWDAVAASPVLQFPP